MALMSVLLEVLQRPSIGDAFVELVLFMILIWLAVFVGVLVGWAWKPKWANLGREMVDSSKNTSPTSPSCSTASSGSVSSLNDNDEVDKRTLSVPKSIDPICSAPQNPKENSNLVNLEDLEHLCRIVEEKDGGPAWIEMMDRSTPTIGYRAWRRDPATGPPQYRSSTVFEDATLGLVRDFFWDDEFRLKWDDMLNQASILEECTDTGTMVVHWVRKFPFFCSDREYIIGRRIWKSGKNFYCVTKGVPYPSMPRHNKPRRVDLYYSSWCIRTVESNRGDGQMTACEVLLFHHEDMGIPWEVAKLGVRHGMWGVVMKVEPAFRAYQKERTSGAALSRCAIMAQINNKVSSDYLRSLNSSTSESSEIEPVDSPNKPLKKGIPKLLVVGGAIALACSIDRGLMTKAVIFGAARRFANIGKRL